MLRRAAARYRGRKGTFARNKRGTSPLSNDASFEVGREESPVLLVTGAESESTTTGAPDELAGRLHAVVLHNDPQDDEQPSVIMTASANVSYNVFLKSYGLDDGDEPFNSVHSRAPTTQGTPDEVEVKPLAAIPRAKFRVRGPLIKHEGEEAASSLHRVPTSVGKGAASIISPRGVRQTVTKRDDLPLTAIGVTSQTDACVEERERHVAKALRMDWDFYSRIVLKGARHMERQQRIAVGATDGQTEESASCDLHTLNLGKSEQAKQMRCVYVPPIPPTKPPSRPSGTRQGRVPLTARDQEKFAVARLLGEGGDRSSGGDAPTMAMDDFYLMDRGSMKY
ncbi:Hypothetical protein, putative [Bodo saltans]|uniref:Uncharacterized protein n=1 Tax=Bodo saltans TaxID=75058 RepID=A0A0S4IXF1_BODSA|nr:Hypothetical protein, putative [Bodo saltans]|eukprot:CUG06432.1 Hypothetical protein, putative [Bodo saltans]